jgi:AraC-like DNA-binding protein
VAGTRTLRYESETGGWEVVLAEPDVRLRRDVLVLEDYAERAAEPVRQRHLPPLFIPLIVNFGPPYRLLDPHDSGVAAQYGSFTSGLGETGAVTESPGTARCVQVNLTPLGARRVFGVPMHELADQVVPLADLFGREAEHLEERLAEAPHATARLSLVESFISARLADAAAPRPDVAYAWRRLSETGGSLRIGTLAAELGCSRKHLAGQFRDQLGLAPKAAARLLRFNRALRLVERGLDGAEVAFRCGYADQAHFVKEFRRFSGSTPAALATTAEVRFLQDADGLAA